MAIWGDQTTKLLIERQAAQFCQDLRSALTGVTNYQAWLTGTADADLLALGFTASDVATLRGAFADGAALAAYGAGTIPPYVPSGVQVYRGTAAGAENVLVATLGVVTSYTDTGTAGIAGTPPVLNSAQLPPPTGLAVTASAGSSSFASGTYYWKIAVVSGFGFTSPSLEVSAALATGGTAALTWNTLAGGYPQPSATFPYLRNITQLIGPQ